MFDDYLFILTFKIGRLSTTDEDFFAIQSSSKRNSERVDPVNYTPTFVEDLVASNTDPTLNATCNYVQACIADALMTGLTKFGTQTGSTLTSNVDKDTKLSKNNLHFKTVFFKYN